MDFFHRSVCAIFFYLRIVLSEFFFSNYQNYRIVIKTNYIFIFTLLIYICIYIHIYVYMYVNIYIYIYCPVGWGCRIHRLLLCRGVRPSPNERPGYDTKQSDGEVPAMLELWGMRSTPSLPSLPGPLWPGVVAPDKGPIYGLNRTQPCFFHYTDLCI